MRAIKLLLVLVVVVTFVADQASAVTVGPGETYQEWDFGDPENPAIPTVDVNPFGTATATISSTLDGPPPEWLVQTLGRDGVWTGEGRLEVSLAVPNEPIRHPWKEIIIEIGFFGELNGFAVYTDPFGETVELVDRTLAVGTDGWSTLIDRYFIVPNPDREWINYHWVGEVVALDYVNLYTISAPEPMTIALLGLGGLMLRRRRRTV